MKAVVLRETGDPGVLRVEEVPDPAASAGAVVVRLRAAALNRRDLWIRRGRYPRIAFPIILGSDGVGEVVGAGEGVDPDLVGRVVIIDPAFNWGGNRAAQGA